MFKKVTACLSIFFMLLAGAFVLDRQNSGTAGPADGDPTFQIQQAGAVEAEEKRPRVFAPREYVKIVSPE
ncbi:hypothetical protein WQ57_03525 [Mesobacillus campisalis]|uniref:Uncharacterized protein n=1 Tax=Mesobacillus campisalis TaxID=1408103 RepID=A0A0M2SYQ9_9BACI|nr:hypothetical protein [Mesobacillus campisalis]KKK39313.1 hypothetical protein WQ57_03525 [Mesobacillus campisalis]